jgi:hypothetical protein
MGLDIVEMVCAIEETFQIDIANSEAELVRTVGDLYNLLLTKVGSSPDARCLTSAAFYRTRKGLVDVLGLDRRQIRPSTELVPLLPRGDLRPTWDAIGSSMQLKLPNLEHPPWVLWTLLGVVSVLCVTSAAIGAIPKWGALLIFLMGFGAVVRFVASTPSLARCAPEKDKTVGDLARHVLALNSEQLTKQVGGWSKQEIWSTMCRVIVDQTGVKQEELRMEARFVEDLRLD